MTQCEFTLINANCDVMVVAASEVFAASPEELMLNVSWYEPLAQYYTGGALDGNSTVAL